MVLLPDVNETHDRLLLCIQGIKKSFDYKKILKALKKEYCCNGTVVEDEELGQVIQVQGDQRKNIADFLTQVCAVTLFARSHTKLTVHNRR